MEGGERKQGWGDPGHSGVGRVDPLSHGMPLGNWLPLCGADRRTNQRARMMHACVWPCAALECAVGLGSQTSAGDTRVSLLSP